MTKNKMCAIIPAAGRGSRLNCKEPKILIPIKNEKTVWHIIYEKLSPLVDNIHVVLSPKSVDLFETRLTNDHILNGVSTSIQMDPIGMGDAIFGAYDSWKNHKNILIIWGDQVFVSIKTLQETIKTHLLCGTHNLTIPISFIDNPYVQYIFKEDYTKLLKIKQTREGDICEKQGFSDVGVFCLSTTGLDNAWNDYLKNKQVGHLTGEINFLPFLSYLSMEKFWEIKKIIVEDPTETRGINTLQDLHYYRRKFKSVS
jgi:bifunctional UDP-N-acetylglucosamine pyrophosphorylase/glucosamine-1-phosphate N-acetyltransferase|tara:strand:+ start:629 stop:1396 length:768 start_codon:yes stop_codon:yes gene_type:complete